MSAREKWLIDLRIISECLVYVFYFFFNLKNEFLRKRPTVNMQSKMRVYRYREREIE